MVRSCPLPAVPGARRRRAARISPSGDGTVTLEVENLYGSLQAAKTLSGDPEAIAELEDFAFTVNWTSDEPDVVGAATSGSFIVTGDGAPAPEPSLAFPTGMIYESFPRRRRRTFRPEWSGPACSGRPRPTWS